MSKLGRIGRFSSCFPKKASLNSRTTPETNCAVWNSHFVPPVQDSVLLEQQVWDVTAYKMTALVNLAKFSSVFRFLSQTKISRKHLTETHFVELWGRTYYHIFRRKAVLSLVITAFYVSRGILWDEQSFEKFIIFRQLSKNNSDLGREIFSPVAKTAFYEFRGTFCA